MPGFFMFCHSDTKTVSENPFADKAVQICQAYLYWHKN